jgi:chemotaxis protein histidine kinase CheA
MVAKNGGHIEVDSKVGEGTSFNIFLKPYESIAKREMTEEA